MKLSLIFLLTFLVSYQTTSIIEGDWKLVSYDAIENIRLSPAYVNADESSRSQIEERFELILSKGEYKFNQGELVYTDLDGGKIKYRNANYKINNDTLSIDEIDREYSRKAIIRFIDADSLVLAPMINGKVGNSNLIFKKE